MNDNIVYICETDFRTGKANAINIMEMSNAFSLAGRNLILVCPETHAPDSNLQGLYALDNRLEILKVKLPEHLHFGNALLFALAAMSQIRHLRRDSVFYTRNPWLYFLLANIMRLPVTCEAHQYRYHQRIHTIIYRFLVTSASKRKNSKGLVAISQVLKNHLVQNGIPQEKILVAHDGVNLEKYNPPLTKENARKKLGLPQGKKFAIYTGSLIPGKGFEQLLEAWCLLKECGMVIIVGGEAAHVEKLKQQYPDANMIFTGKVPPTQVPTYQFAADVLCLPNTFGVPIDDVTSPMKLFEYMAAERPIIAAGMPSIKEVLLNNENALLYPPGDIQALAAGIDQLLSDSKLSNRLTAGAKQTVTEYTWLKRAQHILHFIDNQPMYIAN